jgi:hypothetical protein
MTDVANGRKINSLFGNILTNIISFALIKLSVEKVLYITRPETLILLANVGPRLTPRTTNRAYTCKMTVSGLVMQITIIIFR